MYDIICFVTSWVISSVGRAPALQAGCRQFEPVIAHHIGAVAQLVRVSACHAGGRGFEPHLRRHSPSVAQSVEQGTENPRVGGSIPPRSTILCGYNSVVECNLAKVEVESSNLFARSI